MRRVLLWRGGLRLRVSLVALLIASCGNNGTAAPITSGVLPTSAAAAIPPSPVVGSGSVTVSATSSNDTSLLTCEPDVGISTFTDRGIGPTLQLESRVLYSWTTLEQAEELVAGGPLLSRTERPGEGPGHALEYLRDQYYPVSEDDKALQELLLSETFARARYAWPYAWATRMGWPATESGPAETYGNQLLRIVVKPTAVWAVVEPGGLKVVDNDGVPVALAEASRIAGLYFVRGEGAGGVDCGGGSFGPRLFTSFREFILMNPDMIESWELGTDVVREAVRGDIQQLTDCFEAIRSCPDVSAVEEWAANIACANWDMPQSASGGYALHLALLNANYLPRAAEIAAIVSTLEQDLAEWTLEVTWAESMAQGSDSGTKRVSESEASDATTLGRTMFGDAGLSASDSGSIEPGSLGTGRQP